MEDLEVRVGKKVVKNSYVILSLLSDSDLFDAKPGQFLMVKPPSPETLLRRPFSVFNQEGKKFEILFQICGKGTLSLSKVEEGDNLRVLGPLGNGFQFEKSGSFLLVGGGRGIAPLFFLSKVFLKEKIKFKVLYGGKTSSDLPALDYFKKEKIEPILTTEDGSAGIKGLVTDPLEELIFSENFSEIFACGPKGMMKKVFEIAKKFQIPTQFSLEERMACGFGACWGCVARIRKNNGEEWVKVCKEGPVFKGEDIVW
jgi:dihydroorotate dehydrogenase electron transfer subunit